MLSSPHQKALTTILALLLNGINLSAAHAASASQGAQWFEQECADCHTLIPGKNKKGPTLLGVVGRTAGQIADYRYSKAMKSLNAQWTAEKLDAYLQHPGELVPGGKMDYDGLNDASARADLIEFLTTRR